MMQEILCDNKNDADGNPTGGCVTGTGIDIRWQDGPLGSGDDRKEPNGAFVEGVLQAALERLVFFQQSKFACNENACAIIGIQTALEALNSRTKKREEQGVEGTHETHE